MTTKSVTLMELMIAIVLLMVVVIGLYSINSFSHYQVISSSRRARVQNEVSYSMEHMGKELLNAAGNEMITGQDTVVHVGSDAMGPYMLFQADTDNDGTADTWRGYRLMTNTFAWCQQCSTAACTTCQSWAWANNAAVLSSNITQFQVDKPSNPLVVNYINTTVTGCWNAAAGSCGTPDNPEFNMTTRISLPQVSTN